MDNSLVKRQAAIDALDQIFDRCEEIEAHLPEGDPDRTGYKMYSDYVTVWKYLHQLPSAQPEWNNHTVACLLAELFDDTCACNYNGIDEWLPSRCEVIDSCPDPVGVACWEQYLKHRVERGTDG